VEGSPIGGHFDHRIYDDIETETMARNPEQLDQCYESLLMSRALGREGGTEIIIGTYYSHCGVLVKLGEKKDIHGNNMYKLLIKAATDDGTITGKPVFFTQEYLDDMVGPLYPATLTAISGRNTVKPPKTSILHTMKSLITS